MIAMWPSAPIALYQHHKSQALPIPGGAFLGLTTFHAILHTLLMARLTFCGNNMILHYVCDVSALLKLTSSDIQVNELVIFIMGRLLGVILFLLIIIPYAHIVFSIFRDFSSQGIHKVFSTCGSHLSVVSLFYGTCYFTYSSPSANSSAMTETVISPIYTVATLMLNTFIYRMRKRDMHGALRRVLCKNKIPSSYEETLGIFT
jgi:olfactory receptor